MKELAQVWTTHALKAPPSDPAPITLRSAGVVGSVEGPLLFVCGVKSKCIACVKCEYVHVQRAPALVTSSVITACSACESGISGNNKDVINPNHAFVNEKNCLQISAMKELDSS